jgi:hypothetical protein
MVSMTDWKSRAGKALRAKHPTLRCVNHSNAVIPGVTRDPSVRVLAKPSTLIHKWCVARVARAVRAKPCAHSAHYTTNIA